ncbi:hypothetical protein C8F04DRAFT_1115992 [Mycena alexandri]|uniref:Secreted protein n=1 Tax=Mycena alexandri TaxID=1745969 RepID=A0AAD6X2D2_9AGAR|nr:hypothetical protein C8F04DRAFT_1115992 [Mycena alexandri]
MEPLLSIFVGCLGAAVAVTFHCTKHPSPVALKAPVDGCIRDVLPPLLCSLKTARWFVCYTTCKWRFVGVDWGIQPAGVPLGVSVS